MAAVGVNWDLLKTASSIVIGLFSASAGVYGIMVARAVSQNTNSLTLKDHGERLTAVEGSQSASKGMLSDHAKALALIDQNLSSAEKADSVRDVKLDKLLEGLADLRGEFRGRGR